MSNATSLSRRYLLSAAVSLVVSLNPESSIVHAAPVRVLPLGDSLTEASPGYRGPLLELMRQSHKDVEFTGPKHDATSRHAGFGGFTIGPGPSKADAWSDGKGSLHAQVDSILTREQPDVILLLIGVNDYFNIGELDPAYTPEQNGPKRLGALLDKIHGLSPSSRILFSSILPVEWDGAFAAGFNRQLPALAESRTFSSFIPLHERVGFKMGDWTDQLHLSETGNAKLALAWAEALAADAAVQQLLLKER